MSLVNQMLKDLEQRRAQLPDDDGLRGLRPASGSGAPRRRRWPAALVVAGLLGSGVGWGLAQTRALPLPPVAVPTDVAEVTAEAANRPAEDAALPEPHTAAFAAAARDAAPSGATAATPDIEPATSARSSRPSAGDATGADSADDAFARSVTREADPGPATAAAAPQMHKTLREPTPRERAAQRLADARQALGRGDVAAAEGGLRAALDADPADAVAAETLTVLLLKQNRAGDAERVLAAALERYPRHPRLAQLHARLLADAGRNTEAVAVLEAAATDEPDVLALLAALQQRVGNDAAAASSYRRALRAAPHHGLWWLGLGISLERDGQAAAALEAYRTALGDASLNAQTSDYLRTRIAALGKPRG